MDDCKKEAAEGGKNGQSPTDEMSRIIVHGQFSHCHEWFEKKKRVIAANLILYGRRRKGDAVIVWPHVKALAERVRQMYIPPQIDWEMIHDAGCTWDNTDLPEHISTVPEIETLLQSLRMLISKLPCKPNVITISRSSLDDYCPQEDVDWIQEQVLMILKDSFEIKVKNMYLEEN
uniref:Uncharacterized protein n=1 Tax=Rhodnius prolixus TaxID=13249 RepID=T1H9Q8_RHOPR